MAQPELQRPLQETLAEAEARIAEMRRKVAEEEAKLKGPAARQPPASAGAALHILSPRILSGSRFCLSFYASGIW